MRVSIAALFFCVLALAGCGQRGAFAPSSGMAPSRAMLAAQAAGSSTTFTMLYQFTGNSNPAGPIGPMLYLGGKLYGTADGGGNSQGHYGAVFSLTPGGAQWAMKPIYWFSSGQDGNSPYGGVTADAKGALYGPTAGGAYTYGTVYKLVQKGASWTHTVAYAFNATDGDTPNTVYVDDATGILYGTTQHGGGPAGCESLTGCGVFYSLTPSGSGYKYAVLYAFKGGSDAGYPIGRLVRDKSGTFYGTSIYGGINNTKQCSEGLGCGTIFKLTPSGKSFHESVAYKFKGGLDGNYPFDGLAFGGNAATSKTLFGTTAAGGDVKNCSNNSVPGCGTVFSFVPGGKKRVLHNFEGYPYDGTAPVGGVTSDANKIYGTTTLGGIDKSGTGAVGTVWTITYKGAYSVVVTFSGQTYPSGGRAPMSALVSTKNGVFGASQQGGTSANCGFYGCGTVFRLNP